MMNDYIAKLLTTSFLLLSCMPSAKAAKQVSFISGAFKRSISVSEIEKLANTGKATGFLKDILRYSNQKPDEVSNLLTQKVDLPIVFTSKLMDSKIGEELIGRVAKIIYPSKVRKRSVSIPAIRAGVIQGIASGNGSLTIIQFIKAYPNRIMTINLPAASNAIDKVETIDELVRFFSNSPLKGESK